MVGYYSLTFLFIFHYSLEKANARLLDELQQKELEYDALQEDVRDLNERLVKFRDEHSKELSKFSIPE